MGLIPTENSGLSFIVLSAHGKDNVCSRASA